MVLRSARSLLGSALTLVLIATSASAGTKPAVNTGSRGDVAIKGYDVVAYTSGAPLRGSSAHEFRWNGAVWRFATAENRDRFASDPEKYAPQFGGYCAFAVSRGYTADVDPHAFKIVDGKLYLNYSKRVQRQWEQDLAGNIVRGHANWPTVLEK